jgi:hypothetical protein
LLLLLLLLLLFNEVKTFELETAEAITCVEFGVVVGNELSAEVNEEEVDDELDEDVEDDEDDDGIRVGVINGFLVTVAEFVILLFALVGVLDRKSLLDELNIFEDVLVVVDMNIFFSQI